MSEPATASAEAAPQQRPRRLTARRAGTGLAVLGVVAVSAWHGLGGPAAVRLALWVAGAVAVLAVLRWYPHLRRHFAPFGRRPRRVQRRASRSTPRGRARPWGG